MGGGLHPDYDSDISTLSTESMVEITTTRAAADPANIATPLESTAEVPEPHEEDARHRLIYSKSKVYVYPTAYARDNIPGFVALVKRESINPTYLLAWIPESLLDERGREEWDKFVRVETGMQSRPQATNPGSNVEEDEDIVLIDAPPPKGESYAFSVPLTSIYSIIVQTPTLSSWYGSATINLINGSTLPTLHFHDDESRSIQLSTSPRTSPTSTWGGEDLLQRLRNYSNVLRSTLEPTLFLIDPSRADIEAHTTPIFSDDAVDLILAQSSSSPIPPHRRPQRPSSAPNSVSGSHSPRARQSILHETFAPSPIDPNAARNSLLTHFSQITRATRHAAQQILSHPLAKPILPHLPDPVKSLVHVNGEWASWVEKGGVGEFESARVYLARWARVVAEAGELSRQKEARRLKDPTDSSEETSDLGVFELLASTSNLPTPKPTRNPKDPINLDTWNQWLSLDRDAKPSVSFDDMRKEVFRRGLTPDTRKKAWPLVLGAMAWDVSNDERKSMWERKEALYYKLKAMWCGVEEVYNREDIVEERHRIDVDCRRTDRTHPIFAIPVPEGMDPNQQDDSQTASNEHVDRLSTILLTYNIYEKELGYVQGMSDLCAPIYVVCGGDEALTFWCFVSLMDRMTRNFLRDQSGMKKQLLTLQQLIAVMDPELYKHFEKTESLHLFFCFRWVLIAFKREFPFDDILRLWEVLWTDYYSNQFVLFVALAILESHRDVILRYLEEFDEILKYCNDLSMTIELDSTLAQAEVLFVSFAQIVADVDRRQAEEAASSGIGLRWRGGGKGASPATNAKPPVISDNLRELLETGH